MVLCGCCGGGIIGAGEAAAFPLLCGSFSWVPNLLRRMGILFLFLQRKMATPQNPIRTAAGSNIEMMMIKKFPGLYKAVKTNRIKFVINLVTN